ncbi:MAG: hypothetical protein R2932_39380 [Caldilineaceae bacterium]
MTAKDGRVFDPLPIATNLFGNKGRAFFVCDINVDNYVLGMALEPILKFSVTVTRVGGVCITTTDFQGGASQTLGTDLPGTSRDRYSRREELWLVPGSFDSYHFCGTHPFQGRFLAGSSSIW